MRKSYILPLIALPLTLAACDRVQERVEEKIQEKVDEKAEVSISTGDGSEDGKTNISINADGFKLDLDIPDLNIDARTDKSDKIYPGSKITGLNVNANRKNGKGDAEVELRFTSPAGSEEVATWFADKMRKDGGTATISGNTVTGTSDEGKAFTLRLDGDGDTTKGTLNLTE